MWRLPVVRLWPATSAVRAPRPLAAARTPLPTPTRAPIVVSESPGRTTFSWTLPERRPDTSSGSVAACRQVPAAIVVASRRMVDVTVM